MRHPVLHRLSWSIALAVLAALALIGVNESSYQQASRAQAAVTDGTRTRLTLSLLLQHLLDAETGQRGYLLTADPRYRQPYDSAGELINADLALLRKLYAHRPDEQERVAALAAQVRRKLSEMDLSIRLREQQHDDAWKLVLDTDVGRESMRAIRDQTAALQAMSNGTIAAGEQRISRALVFSRIGISLITLMGLLAFILYLRQSHALALAGERQQKALQREHDRLEVQVRERTARLGELATHLQDVREAERRHLARELHDELGSLLTAAKLDAARLKSRLTTSPDAVARLDHLTTLLNSGIALKRRIIEDLHPSSLSNLGLVASLEILTREFSEQAGVGVDVALEQVALDDTLQLTVYRLVQESLTNISKYAQATAITVVLKQYPTHVEVEVADNGKGFDQQTVRPSAHGLQGMRHRVEAAGGRLTVRSAPGQGTRIHAVLPAAPRRTPTHTASAAARSQA